MDLLNSEKIHVGLYKNKKIIQKVFEIKLEFINKLIDRQIQLTDLYLRGIKIKKHLGLSYNENIVVNNALLSRINLNYSIVLLLENSFFGSARVLLRQYFEYLVIAKFSEFDNGEILKKWQAKSETRDGKSNINLTWDILNKLKGKDIVAIKDIWKTLSDLSHPTSFAQQIPHISSDDKESYNWVAENYGNIHYTLDLFFMLLCMNYHLLISNWGKKAKSDYFGYSTDPSSLSYLEKEIKGILKSTTKEYFEMNKKYKKINIIFKKVIQQYKQNWTLNNSFNPLD